MRRCKKCVMADTRPRITFDKEGVCSACRYWEDKENVIDWDVRKKELEELCDKYRSKDGSYDCIIPVSGGKDSSYTAWKLKHEYGMHPLTVTFAGNKDTEIGQKNLRSLIDSGFDNILITPDGAANKKLIRKTFIEFGDPFLPFIYGVLAAPFKFAVRFNISLIFYGEDGEVEYGGSSKTANKAGFDLEFIRKQLFSGQSVLKWLDDEITMADLQPYLFPTEDELKRIGVIAVHLSYYENWQPYKHYKFVKEKTGFTPLKGRSEGTYTNFASLDDKHDGIHYFMMFAKFGICRATSDAAHEIREGRITREKGLELVQKYDGEFPKQYFNEFLEDIDMTEEKFWRVVESFINKDIWEQVGDKKWKLKDPEVEKTLKIGSKE